METDISQYKKLDGEICYIINWRGSTTLFKLLKVSFSKLYKILNNYNLIDNYKNTSK